MHRRAASVRVQPHHREAALPLLMVVLLLCAGCSWLSRSDGLAGVTTLPLTPMVHFSPTIATASIPYQNACGEAAALPITAHLTDILPQKLERVFAGIAREGGEGQADRPADGTVEVGLGFKQIDLAIHRQVTKKYPVTITVGLEFAFLADDGTILFHKKLQSAALGEVDVTEHSCEVPGLEPLVREAIDLVGEGMARQMAESVRVQEYAERGAIGAPAPQEMSARRETALEEPLPPASAQDVPTPDAPRMAPRAADIPPSHGGPAQTAALTFRAILRDGNRDQILQPDEPLTIEVEVKNEGTVEAKGVEVALAGTPELMVQLPVRLPVGDLAPGEVKRTGTTQRLTAVKKPFTGELVLSLRSSTPIHAVPLAKKFTVLSKPDAADAEPVADVDHQPKAVDALKQPKAIVIAIGIGRFRDEQVPMVKYAGHDAEMMATYLRAITGIPQDRVRVLVDGQALKQDLAETFDEWIARRADSSTVVYLFFAGRALVDGTTGAVSLVPYDGSLSAAQRLFSVRRLQEALAQTPISRAILMFDVSLEPMPGADPATSALPNWEAGVGERTHDVMWMISHKGLQESHAYEPGRHGLFTYHLLRGLQGVADVDRDGIVGAWELCHHARGEVNRIAREIYGNEQDPWCYPPAGQGAMVRIHPMAKGHHPKPAPATKQEERTDPPAPKSLGGMGPGQ